MAYKVLITTTKTVHGTGGTYGHDPTAVGLTTIIADFDNYAEAMSAVKTINEQREIKYKQRALMLG